MSDMGYVFVSYCSDDRAFAEKIVDELEKHEVPVWWDQNIMVGHDDFRVEIDGKIAGSAFVLLLMSPSAAQSAYVTYEWAYALGKGKKLLIIKYQDTQLHPRLATHQLIEFSQRNPPWNVLTEAVQTLRKNYISAMSVSNNEDAPDGDFKSRLRHALVELLHNNKLPGSYLNVLHTYKTLSIEDMRVIRHELKRLRTED